ARVDERDTGVTHTGDFDVRGGMGGLTGGCNMLVSGLVFGAETDWSWSDKHGGANNLPPFPAANNFVKGRWLTTVRARVGVPWDNWLFYGTAGAAVSDVLLQVSTLPGGDPVAESKLMTGWAIGAGVEVAVWRNLSLKAEYLYVTFGAENFT